MTNLKVGKYIIVSPNDFLLRAIITSVSVGKDKQSMSVVGENMNVCDVCHSFGSYVKFQVEDSQDHREPPTNTGPDAFAVLMANQHLICLVDGMGLKWHSGEVNSGKSFLANVLWYIDGHHESFASRSCEIPKLFEPF
jgi:hypothetical protein